MFRPGNLLDLSSPWFGRSHLLERRLADLYQGKTFADLPRQPRLLVSATDLSLGASFATCTIDAVGRVSAKRVTRQCGDRIVGLRLRLTRPTSCLPDESQSNRPRSQERQHLRLNRTGRSFEFTWHQFGLICSDLGSVPLSFAVAASSAVPIALSPMTLKNHNADCPRPARLADADSRDYRVRLLRGSQRSYLDAQTRPYIHLVDGGLADNLGLRSLLDRAQADGGLRQTLRGGSLGKVRQLVIVAVNAERDPAGQIDSTDQVPGTWSVVDALLFGSGARATQETLGLLSDTVQDWRLELRRQAADDDPFAPDAQIHLINVNLRDAPELLARRRLLQVPTAFSIPAEDADSLIQAGRSILRASPEFQALLQSLQAAHDDP